MLGELSRVPPESQAIHSDEPLMGLGKRRLRASFVAAPSQPMIHETSLGLTLLALTVIGGKEIQHLVHVIPALAVMVSSLTATLWAYKA